MCTLPPLPVLRAPSINCLGSDATSAVAPARYPAQWAPVLRLMPDFKGNATQGNSGSPPVLPPSLSCAQPRRWQFEWLRYRTFTTSGNSYGMSVGRGGIFTSARDTGAISQLFNKGSTFPMPAASPSQQHRRGSMRRKDWQSTDVRTPGFPIAAPGVSVSSRNLVSLRRRRFHPQPVSRKMQRT